MSSHIVVARPRTDAPRRVSGAGIRRPPGWAAKVQAVTIIAGEHYVTAGEDDEIVTILGSCIAACIRDPDLGVGGMNHFMLPGNRGGEIDASSAMRYGHFAMERLINVVVGRGGRRERLEVKLFGAANVMRLGPRIGDSNAAFVRRYLADEGLPIDAEDLGGQRARRIHYRPHTGQVMRLSLPVAREVAVFESEERLNTALAKEDLAGSVELFE